MHRGERTLRSAVTVPLLATVTFVGFSCHAVVLTSSVVDLVVVLIIVFRWGFVEGAVATAAAAAFLDFFYMPPILSFYEREPQDWIATLVFAFIAILLSRFVGALQRQARDIKQERARLERLYLTCRDILLMNRGAEIGAQITRLIDSIFKTEVVALWDAREAKMDRAGKGAVADDEVRAIYFNELSESDELTGHFKRVLRLGTRSVGALYIVGSTSGSFLDSRSVDAVASLAALALERAHSFLAETNAEAVRRSGQLRSTVLDGLAHAFKTPLATIQIAAAGLLEVRHLGQECKELASLIESEALRLANLTGKVLETAELDEAEFRLDYELILVNEFLEECQTAFAAVVSSERLIISEGDLLGHVWSDRRLLRLTLLQIIDNAAKYARPGSAIRLSAFSKEAETLFSVHNEGSYVAPKERLRIFDRFYRSAEAQYKAPGTGVGLAVARRIIDAHGGRVWVDSTPDEQTTFFIALPHVDKESCHVSATR